MRFEPLHGCRAPGFREVLTTKRCPSGSWLASTTPALCAGRRSARRMMPKSSWPPSPDTPSSEPPPSTRQRRRMSAMRWRKAGSLIRSSQRTSRLVCPVRASSAVVRSFGGSRSTNRAGTSTLSPTCTFIRAVRCSRVRRRTAVRASNKARLRSAPTNQRRLATQERSSLPASTAASQTVWKRSSASVRLRAARRASRKSWENRAGGRLLFAFNACPRPSDGSGAPRCRPS
jgi:hypothetical protein